jgi:putative ABC transport system permease protein
MDEIRLALRRVTTRPAASVASILTLACAIGAASATWSLLSALLLRPLPVRDPDTLVVVGQERPTFGTGRSAIVQTGLVYPWYPLVRDSGIFDRTTAVWAPPRTLLVDSGTLANVPVSFVVHDFFSVLGISISRGRDFRPDDDRRGAAHVAVISDRFWRLAFGASDVLGRGITVARQPVTIVGVAPRGFRGLDLAEAPDLFMPLQTIAELAGPTYDYFVEGLKGVSPSASVNIVGRLRSADARSEAAARLSNLSPPAGFGPARLAMMPVNQVAVPQTSRTGMTQFAQLLTGTVGLLLLVGCATVGMLLLIRTEARREEFAVCLALGASRARLACGIASEGMLLSIAGAALSIPVSWWLFRSVRAFTLPGRIDIELLGLSIDTRAIAVAGGAAMLAMLLIALIAGVFGFRADTAEALRSRSGATPRTTRRRTRAALVAGQVAVALVLTAGAGLLARSLVAALHLNNSIGMDRVATAMLDLHPHGYAPPRAQTFFAELDERLGHVPEIASFAYSVRNNGMSPAGRIDIDGIMKQFPATVWYVAVDPHYFQTMRMRIMAGRDFSADDRPGAPLVTIVSESFGRMLADGGTPLDRNVTTSDGRMRVVGVVSDVVTNVSILEPPVLYMPLAQYPVGDWRTLIVRAATDPNAARREIVSAIRQVDPAVVPPPIITLEEQIARQMSSQYFGATVLGTLGAIAVLLTGLGTYATATSMAQLRAREMGIRAALGAQAWQLGATVLAETGWLVGMGLVAGFGVAWLGAKTIRGFLFQVQPFDPVTLAGVCALIFSLALAVSLGPALRAARVDLAQVLRQQ